jgi:hypothetical protein
MLKTLKDILGLTLAAIMLLSPFILGVSALFFALSAILFYATPCGAASLGEMSANQWRYESTSNAYGPHGSEWTYGSVNNPYGPNGSEWSTSSATNPYAIDPPTINSSGIYEGD